ncbi:MAG TPA: hypothetical protein ENL37_02950 [Desulfobacteraceae bacterium]|nr:hypothetical protein [Desulfobacteraceae bacterium]
MKKKKTTVINAVYKETYYDLYTGREPIMFKSVKELPGDRLGIRVAFGSNMKDVAGFLVSADGKNFKESKTGSTSIVFEDNDQLQEKSIFVKAMFDSGEHSPALEVKFRAAARKFFISKKMKNHPAYITVKNSPPVPLVTSGPEDFTKPVSSADKRFARKQWGHHISEHKSSYENAISLAKAIMHELWPHNGFPSDAMTGLRPFQQYKRMVSGKDFGFCSNFAMIFTCACNALSISTRQVNTGCIISITEKVNIQLGTQHASTEIFDDKTNQWIWLDLQFYALGVFLGKEGPLSMAELHLFLDNPVRRKRLRLKIYDMDTKTEKMIPLNKSSVKDWDYFEGASRSLSYTQNPN